jgi:ABC-type transport system involved in cytochrome c biogenesis permease subunit
MTQVRLASILVLLAAQSLLAAGPEIEPLRTLAIQDGGRLKPLDTFARSAARRIGGAKPFTGGETVLGLDPVEWVLSMLAAPDRWRSEPVVKVTHAGLRDAVRLPRGKDRYSLAELADHDGLRAAVERLHARGREDRDAKFDPVEQEILTLWETLGLMSGIASGEALKVVPHPTEPTGSWFAVADLREAPAGTPAHRAKTLSEAMIAAYAADDREGVASSASALRRKLEEMAPSGYPAAAHLRMEVHYNRFKPFRWAWVAYLFGFLLLLTSLGLGARIATLSGFGLVGAGFLLNSYGMWIRMQISGRPPVTNMYESVVFVAWGAVLFALIFEAVYRARYFAACASVLAVVSLILADNVPILDGSIDPLVPVLRDNMWLTVHVLTITLGYAAFLLAMGIGHVNLGLYFFAPQRKPLLKTLSMFLYRALQVGTLFLAVGTLLGGVWASYSWGRFWGWDPKETWALIALLGYLAILHGRFIGWFKDFGMAVGSLVGFLGVLMAWYGVNFILGTGLHSYGFGSGGYTWIGSFVLFELVVIGLAAFRRRAEMARQAAPPARTAAAEA